MHLHRSPFAVILLFACSLAHPQTPAPPSTPVRPVYPTRAPDAPGFVGGKELADGAVPPADQDGNFVLGPTHAPAPATLPQTDVPHGAVSEFVLNSADSKFYPGIARDPGTFGEPDPKDPAKLVVTTSHPAPYSRRVTVYVPKQYVAGTVAPFIVGADGPTRCFSPLSTTSSPSIGCRP